MRGGIARYTEQVVMSLREEGHEVAIAAPRPAAAEYALDISQPGAGRRLAQLAKKFDRLVIQFQPEILGDPTAGRLQLAKSLLRLGAALRAARDSELCIHEIGYGVSPMAPVMRSFFRRILLLARRITVHTERERQDLVRTFRIDAAQVNVVSQGRYARKAATENRSAARDILGLPLEPLVLLCIGFLHPRKGFDRAICAFAGVPPDAACLYVVGSLWREDQVSRDHVMELRRLAAETPGVELREEYVDDEDFDRWIVASDALVLPYQLGWSSNVLERGLLYERPVIMSSVGGMSEQGRQRQGVTLVKDDAELAAALRDLLPHLADRRTDG
jgi:glycosyltransferase involved in cell wall biosynthesis